MLGGSAVIAVTGYLSVSDTSSVTSKTVGTLAPFAGVLFATLACVKGALRRTAYSRAWAYLSVALLLCATSSALSIGYQLAYDNGYPFPTLSDFAYLAYVVPSVAALLALPRPPAAQISRLRAVLDGLVVASGVLFLSWITVLGPVVAAMGLDSVPGLTMAAFPVVDVIVCSTVLSLGMRQPPGERLTWLLLGSGLVVMTITDSVYVRLVADGATNAASNPWLAGWTVAPVLVALATFVRPSHQPAARTGPNSLGLEFIPYVPVLAAVVVLAVQDIERQPVVLLTGTALVVCLLTRQLMVVLENVTLTRNLERKVAELARLATIVTSSRDAITGVSVDGLVTSWNPAAEALYGYSAAEVIGHESTFISPTDRDGLQAVIESTQRGEPIAASDMSWTRPDGTTVQIATVISPIWDGATFRGVSIAGHDVTEEREFAESLKRARSEALQSSRLKSEFMATMSHEIRTPMNGVIGLTGLLLETPLDPTQRQYAEGVQSAGDALLGVINDVLDFSKLEAGKVDLEVVDFDVRSLVEDVGRLLAPVAFGKGLELLAYCSSEVPVTLRGDPSRVRQILLNLAGNGVKFTEAGHVAISVQLVSLEGEQARIRFEVADTGIGVGPDARHLLFRAFAQADASTTRRFGGTGLGLAISRRLVQAMHGWIDVESEEGVGSTFWFEVPLALGSSASAAMPTPAAEPLLDVPVIVVGGNRIIREVVTAQLTAWGMRPDAVEDAQRAMGRMRAMAAQGRPYAIVVLDIAVRDRTGLELARTIAAEPALSGARIIMLAASHRAGDEVGLSGVEWLAKPVRSSELYDRVQGLTDATRPPSAEKPLMSTPGPSAAAMLGRILVVEDNALNQLVAEGMVARLGYQVNIVANGLQALEALATTVYSAVLMDCHMPIMDGFEATMAIRGRQDRNTAIPIIAMTAGAMVEDRKRCLDAGMDDYISKPIDLAAVGALLRKWIPAAPSSPNAPADPLAFEVDLFLRHAADSLAAIRLAVRVDAADDLAQAAHTLGGACYHVGASRVADLCLELEHRGPLLDPTSRTDLVDQLSAELDAAVRDLNRVR